MEENGPGPLIQREDGAFSPVADWEREWLKPVKYWPVTWSAFAPDGKLMGRITGMGTTPDGRTVDIDGMERDGLSHMFPSATFEYRPKPT